MKHQATWLFFCLFITINVAYAKKHPPQPVHWNQPLFEPAPQANVSRVTLSGIVAPKTEVFLNADTIPVIDKDGSVDTLRVDDILVTKKRRMAADHNGHFIFILDLPLKTAQLTFVFRWPNGQTESQQTNINVRKPPPPVQLMTHSHPTSIPQKVSLWGGIGVNYTQYEHSSPDIPADVNFSNVIGPSFYAKVVRSLNPTTSVQITANSSPGRASSSSAIQVRNGDYNWVFITGDVNHYPKSWKSRFKGRLVEFGVLAGLQHHVVPFLTRSSGTDPGEARIVTNDINFAAFGGIMTYHFDSSWLFEMFMRYELPISSGDLYQISPNIAFDGSVGAVYNWNSNLRIGGFWYGQYLDFDFSDHTDTFFAETGNSDPLIGGRQTHLFSNFELRMGWEFN
jgi:hypothetical protein